MPRIVDSDARRHEIVLGVLQVMITRGIESVSLRSVAAAAGVSMGRVQHYFASKEDLLVHACRTMADLATENYQETTEATPRQRLQQLLHQAIPNTPKDIAGLSAWYMFTTAAPLHPGISTVLNGGWSALHAEICSLLAEVPHPPGSTPEARAHLLAGCLDGLALRVINETLTPEQAHVALDAAIDLVWNPED